MRLERLCLIVTLIISFFSAHAAYGQSAQPATPAEETFREIFVTAGLSAAFGAATGAALLPFFPEHPMQNLRFVAGGASLGFIGGSALAIYNISQRNGAAYAPAAPQYADDEYAQPEEDYRASEPIPHGAIISGQGERVALRIPLFIVTDKAAIVQLASWKF